MKNMLGIKRISSILLVGTMAVGSSAMNVKASNDVYKTDNREIYMLYDPENKKEKISVHEFDMFETEDNDSVWHPIGNDAQNFKFFQDGRQISEFTPVRKVKNNANNSENSILIVTPNTELTAEEIYAKTEEAREKISFTAKVYYNNTGETKPVTIVAHKSDMAARVLDKCASDHFGYEGVAEHVDQRGNPLDSSNLTVEELANKHKNDIYILVDDDNDED